MVKGIVMLLTVLFFSLTCQSQTDEKERSVYSKDFNWTITIPEGFDTVTASEWEKLQQRGTEAVEKTYNGKVENQAKIIFVFRSDRFNYFESNYQPFDPVKDGSYSASLKEVKDIVYKTFETQMQGIKIDSSSSAQTISGLVFQTFHVVISFPNGIVMKWEMFNRLFDNKDFTVNIMTVDNQKEKELLAAWTNSKFGK